MAVKRGVNQRRGQTARSNGLIALASGKNAESVISETFEGARGFSHTVRVEKSTMFL